MVYGVTMGSIMLKRIDHGSLPALRRDAVDPATLEKARAIVDDVRERGETALREHAERLGDIGPDEALVRSKAELAAALEALPKADRKLLERTARRIRLFAERQRACLRALTMKIPGGQAGHVAVPVERAGCYAPGGRFPLPSSVLMTVVTARAAGVSTVWAASPRPAQATLAAAAVAGADALLAVGGAQAIAALAYGAGEVPACDVVVGPGNRWVTAAKQLCAGRVGIDMLAGPSELVVLADASADPAVVAADLLAQAEHDPDAMPILVTVDAALADAVDAALSRQLAGLPTAPMARAALGHGFAVVVKDIGEAVGVCNRIAPEHIELHVRDAKKLRNRLANYGALFVGAGAAEVMGDYGAGPNHVLPTGGTARFAGGLSVFTFLRVRTWMEVTDPAGAREVLNDAAAFARIEGLEAHARAAEIRRRR